MSRLLLQANAVLANSTASPSPSPPTNSGGAPKSGVIYTFTFIGATVLVGLLFLALMFRYIVKYRYFRPPATELLQPAGKPEDEYVSNLPNIKEIVVISNPDGCASVAIVREDEITDGRPPFTTYETMVSKKAFENFSQKYMSSASSSSRSMTHAASASDLAGMGEHQTTQALQTPRSFRQHTPHEKSISEENEDH